MILVPFYQNGYQQYITENEAVRLNLVPVNFNGSTVYITRQEAEQYGGFGLFGSKKRKKVEQQVAQSQQVAQQNSLLAQSAVEAFQKTIPNYQNQLSSAQAELEKEVRRVGAGPEKSIAYVGLVLSISALAYVGIQKFKSRKSK